MCSGIVCYDYLPEDIRSKFKYEDMMNSKSMLDPAKTFGQALEASGILLRFLVNVSERNVYSTARILNHDLLLGFRRLGVECPYPQLDVHSK